jgi:hypothetical protein
MPISSFNPFNPDSSSPPQPATAAPPGVSDSSATGDNMQYALANHTHASKARKQRVTGVNAATYTWTFPTPFTTGAIPICNAIVEDPANTATDSYNVQVTGVPNNMQVTFRIIRQSSGLLSLLLGALSLNPTPGNINLHCLALEP